MAATAGIRKVLGIRVADGGFASLPQGYLQDAVPDLLGQHQPGVGCDAEQRLAKQQFLVCGHLNDVALPQQLDEMAKQALVEEFRRVQLVEQRHALRHEMTAFLKRFACDGAAARLQQ